MKALDQNDETLSLQEKLVGQEGYSEGGLDETAEVGPTQPNVFQHNAKNALALPLMALCSHYSSVVLY